jgi:hypothetical protein
MQAVLRSRPAGFLRDVNEPIHAQTPVLYAAQGQGANPTVAASCALS